MEVRTYSPSRALAPYVRAFQVIETGEEEVTRALLPEPSIIAGFRYAGYAIQLDRDPNPLPDTILTGLRTTTRRMFTSPHAGIVLAKFHDGAAAAFFPQPLHELFGDSCSLEELLPRDAVVRTRDRIRRATHDWERIAIFEALLLAHRRPDPSDPFVAAAIAALRSDPTVRIGALAHDLRISQDALEKRFRRVVGASPKQLASLVRLSSALDLRTSASTLAELSQRAGYYDQSHFIREFRAATGQAPGRFLSAEEFC